MNCCTSGEDETLLDTEGKFTTDEVKLGTTSGLTKLDYHDLNTYRR